jgi:hypothetical protein
MKYLFSILIISTIIILNSCGTKIDPYTNDFNGAEYFPLEIGNTWIYSIDSVIYDNKGKKIDTINHLIKEFISGTFEDNKGNTYFIIERSLKAGKYWNTTDTWYAYLDENKAIESEENLKFIKMIFPIRENASWDGNAYFDSDNTIVRIAGEPIKIYKDWEYYYLSTTQAEDIGENHYENVTTVVQADKENSLEKRYSIEKYAKGTGLIYKNMVILNTQKTGEPNTPWEEKAEEGFILTQKLISFSRN